MPIYEYRCEACLRRFQTLVGMTAEPDDERCPHCGASSAKRLVSRFSRGRDEDARVEELADRMDQYGEPESPSEMRRLAREMGSAMDEDMSEEVEEMLESDLEGGEPET